MLFTSTAGTDHRTTAHCGLGLKERFTKEAGPAARRDAIGRIVQNGPCAVSHLAEGVVEGVYAITSIVSAIYIFAVLCGATKMNDS